MSEIKQWNTAIRECIEWVRSAKLEKPSGTSLHKVMAAFQTGEMIYPPKAPADEAARYYSSALDHAFVPFVVEHDWAGAFAGSGEFENSGGLPSEWDFRTPYPDCCWEFRISGKVVLLLTRFSEEEGELPYKVSAMIETSVGWMALKLSDERNWPIAKLLFEQIRAVCISLDAQVSKTEVIRAPHKLNAARERRGVPSIPDYHVVTLNRRARPEPLPANAGDDEDKRHVRLHFRRGHWRHFESHKTWINWTLVGDPDLGFIDKHYRL
jgi:hypothetical protein